MYNSKKLTLNLGDDKNIRGGDKRGVVDHKLMVVDANGIKRDDGMMWKRLTIRQNNKKQITL